MKRCANCGKKIEGVALRVDEDYYCSASCREEDEDDDRAERK